MNNDKKKLTVDELIQIATEQQVPPLYHTREIDGIIIKTYPFIRGHSKIYSQGLPEKDIGQEDHSLLAAYKNEKEKQLELNRKYCIGQYNHIKIATRNWLTDKFEKVGRPLNIGDEDEYKISSFAIQVATFIYWTMLGVEIKTIKKNLEKRSLPLQVEIKPLHHRKEDDPIVFNFFELIEKVKNQLSTIERVVSRSVDLYFEYVNLQSYLYNLDSCEILSANREEIKSDYGIHGRNSEWISKKWHEIRKHTPSDRQADLELQRLYREKFNGLNISTSQIQRFTDRQ